MSRLDPIQHLCPWAAAEERKLRLRIHRSRDISTARAMRSKRRRARCIYWTASEIANEWVFRRSSTEDLESILQALARLLLVAGAIEQLEAPDE